MYICIQENSVHSSLNLINLIDTLEMGRFRCIGRILSGGLHDRKETFSHNEIIHPILKIATTDVRNKCTLNFQGTSRAAPLVAAGVMALALNLQAISIINYFAISDHCVFSLHLLMRAPSPLPANFTCRIVALI